MRQGAGGQVESLSACIDSHSLRCQQEGESGAHALHEIRQTHFFLPVDRILAGGGPAQPLRSCCPTACAILQFCLGLPETK